METLFQPESKFDIIILLSVASEYITESLVSGWATSLCLSASCLNTKLWRMRHTQMMSRIRVGEYMEGDISLLHLLFSLLSVFSTAILVDEWMKL